jgi:tetratricopeptide (TPR) repeat protein
MEFNRIKCSHLKKKADNALQGANLKVATDLYEEAIRVSPDKDVLKALHGNASLAYAKCNRYDKALEHADEAVRIAPAWGKGHWRRGVALVGLRRLEDAVECFSAAWKIQKDAECYSKLKAVIRSMPKEMLGRKMLDVVDKMLEGQARVVEVVESVVLEEGAFVLIDDIEKKYLAATKAGETPRDLSCYDVCLLWMTGKGPTPVEAFVFRSRACCRAKAYLQAREDAASALDALKVEMNVSSSHQEKLGSLDLCKLYAAAAYKALGDALMADSDHPDRNAAEALKSYTRAQHLGFLGEEIHDAAQAATDALTKEQVELAMEDVYKSPNAIDSFGMNGDDTRESKVTMTLTFKGSSLRTVSSHTREELRQLVASLTASHKSKVTIERVCARGGERISVDLQIMTRDYTLDNWTLRGLICDALRNTAADNGRADTARCIAEQLGILDESCVDIRVSDAVLPSAEDTSHVDGGRTLAPAVPQKVALAVPYKEYKLVDVEGNFIARAPKHAFCMSRVHYDRSEIQSETWVEIGDGSCRWRQTGSEIKVIVLGVPNGVPAKDLHVNFEPYMVSVRNKISGTVYLEGKLHRGIIPDECFWTHLGGRGEDSCCLTMTKMNLEVLQKHWMHSEMWWTKLFEDHPEISWDDYEKDYSDLPEEVLTRHYIREAQKEESKQIEYVDESRRKRLRNSNDTRKKSRMWALEELRDGSHAKIQLQANF